MIIPRTKRQALLKQAAKGEVNLRGLHFDHNAAALMKYLSHCSDTKKVDLSGSDINGEALIELAMELE